MTDNTPRVRRIQLQPVVHLQLTTAERDLALVEWYTATASLMFERLKVAGELSAIQSMYLAPRAGTAADFDVLLLDHATDVAGDECSPITLIRGVSRHTKAIACVAVLPVSIQRTAGRARLARASVLGATTAALIVGGTRGGVEWFTVAAREAGVLKVLDVDCAQVEGMGAILAGAGEYKADVFTQCVTCSQDTLAEIN